MKIYNVTFFVVPCADPVVSDISVIGMISSVAGAAPRLVNELIRLFAIIYFLFNRMLKIAPLQRAESPRLLFG